MEATRALNYGRRKPTEVPKTFWLPDDTPLDETLCTVCRRLDLWKLLRQPAHPPEYAILGFYPEIRKKAAHCRFCKLVVTTIITGWKSTMGLDWDACSNLEETECALDHKLWVMTQPLPSEALKAKIDSGIIEKCGLDVLGEDGVSKGMHESEMFHPRLVEGNVANEHMLKRWMDICVDYHGETCGMEIKKNTLRIPKCVRVIDIEAMRLVPAASRSFFSPKIREYVALSYVWGAVGSKDYETTQANYQQRIRRGGLSDVNFPRTILDAIETTRRLGARYLWIDAVCIIQDSDDDKRDQIGNMNIVYGAAYFTIVAAGSDDARGPIPRSHEGSPHTVQQDVVEINGVRVARPLPTLWDLEWTPSLAPKWFERGWTYQERHLSVRIFVFTTHQVLFQCRIGVNEEGQHTERCSSNKYTEKTIPATWGNVVGASDQRRDPYHYMNSYSKMVQEYSTRHLGQASDALNAFMGVANVLEDQYGPEFKLYYGFAGPYMDESLMWQPAETQPLVRRSGFPSWSWAGWQGPVRYDGSYGTNWQLLDGMTRPLTWVIYAYLIHTEMHSGPVLIQPPKWMRSDFTATGTRDLFYGNGAQKTFAPLPPLPMHLTQQMNSLSVTKQPPGTLEFLAVVVPAESFSLAHHHVHFKFPKCDCLEFHKEPPPLANLMWLVLDRDGDMCGMIGNGVDFHKPDPEKGSTGIPKPQVCTTAKVVNFEDLGERRLAFVCIARSGTGSASNTCPGYDPIKYKKAEGCVWEVLLVEYGVEGLPKNVAVRVAAGRIHEDAWSEAQGAKWERVLLR